MDQGVNENRSIEQTLDIGWDLLSDLPESELKRIRSEFITKYRKKALEETGTEEECLGHNDRRK